MMKYYCDHCGKEINPKDDYIEYSIAEHFWDLEPMPRTSCDLCAECKEEMCRELSAVVQSYLGKE